MAAKRPTPASSPLCKVDGCTLTYDQHSGRLCPSCLAPLEHHAGHAAVFECEAGRARMADARRAAGLDLTRYERQLLDAHPSPPRIPTGDPEVAALFSTITLPRKATP